MDELYDIEPPTEGTEAEKKFWAFLTEYDKVALRAEGKLDYCLFFMLLHYRKDVAGLAMQNPEYFHKAFRQIDVTRVCGMDTVIYGLLCEARRFWEVFDKHYPRSGS